MSVAWATGLVVGGPIGSAISERTTWRWAFYLNIPLIAVAAALAAVCVPTYTFFPPETPLRQRLARVDTIGIAFNLFVPSLFAVGLTFSDAIWHWGSGPSITIWLLFGTGLLLWIAQQYFHILTTAEERALPLHLLSRLDLIPIWIASACAGSAYAVILYYTPLFYAFARGADALGQTVRLLPFTLSFILSVMMTGHLLPVIGRYKLIYVAAGVIMVATSAAMAAILADPNSSDALVMGLEVLLGTALGLHFQHGVGISNVINKHERDRVDSAVFCNLAQMGGIAITLAIAGSIFQNVGYNLLVEAIGEDGLSENELREALAGVSSALGHNETIIRRGIEAVSKVISKEFYLVTTAGSICLICGLFMRCEKLVYTRGNH